MALLSAIALSAGFAYLNGVFLSILSVTTGSVCGEDFMRWFMRDAMLEVRFSGEPTVSEFTV